jgi:hypothetical protein
MAKDKILSPDLVRAHCRKLAARDVTTVDQKAWGAVCGHVNIALKQYTFDGREALDTNRRLVWAFLFAPESKPFEPLSSRELTLAQKVSVIRWVGATYDTESGRWIPRKTWKNEIYWILSVATWIRTITLASKAQTPASYGVIYRMYQVEERSQDVLDADYWLDMAYSLGGVAMEKVYSDGQPYPASFPLPHREHAE